MKPSLGEDIRSVLAISVGALVGTGVTAAFIQARARPVEHHGVNVEVAPVHGETYIHFVPLDHKKKLEVVLMSGPEPLPEVRLRATLHGGATTRIELEQAAAALSEARVLVEKIKVSETEAAYREAIERFEKMKEARPLMAPAGGGGER
jgi:hypothetical protein